MFQIIMSRMRGAAFRRRWGRLPLGGRGERVAAQWLTRRGYRILEQNMTIARDEADLVALAPDGAIVIVEVKTRASPASQPETAIDPDKQRKLARFASRLHARRDFRDRAMRFDAITVIWPPKGEPEVRHFPHAFEVQ